MTFENRIARIEANRTGASGERPVPSPAKRESGLVTLLLWALFLSLVWAAFAYPLGAALAFLILGPIVTFVVVPVLLLRRRQTSPERWAILDLLSFLNPFA
jgi:hypothetical protein